MNSQPLIDYCLQKNGTSIDLPFGPDVICIKVCGKIVAQFFEKGEQARMTVKCTPDFGFFAKQMYPGTVTRGYHCPPVQQPYWITVQLNGIVPEDQLLHMLDHSYDAVLAKLPKRLRATVQP